MEVEDYPNYLIYPDGRVQNKKTKRYLKQQKKKNKYLFVVVCKDGKPKNYNIHRLVAEHYIPNPDKKSCVDHINRDRTDNRIENLRWTTMSENGQNRGTQKNNNSTRVKNISYYNDSYRYLKTIRGKIYRKCFKTLKEALYYKYIFTLKMRAGLV